jgi:hypothetical protein
VKDDDAAHPIASQWRPTLREMVAAFLDGDYSLTRGVQFVAPVPAATAKRISANVAAYGDTLAELPAETWETSGAQWMKTHWDVSIDLWTTEGGTSDLVLSARVFEVEGGFQIEIDSCTFPRSKPMGAHSRNALMAA